MTKQPEAILEHNLIQQLVGLNYEFAKIHDGEQLIWLVTTDVCLNYKT